MTEIKSWGVPDLEFFITTPKGRKRFSPVYLSILWNRWHSTASSIRDLEMTIHGLRATKIDDLRRIGTEDGAIADEIGMSVGMVSRYLRFADKTSQS